MFRKLRNKFKFIDYQQRLISAVKNNTHIQFLMDNGNPFEYYTDFPIADIPSEIKLSHQYYDEIQISKIIGVNAKKITDENFSRVINAVDYILNNQCKPIEVVKLENGYFVLNGKHRLFAHILLRKDIIPVSVRQPCKELIEKDFPLISINRSYETAEGVNFDHIFDFIQRYRIEPSDIINIKFDKAEKLLVIELLEQDTVEIKGAFSGVGRSNQKLLILLEKLGFVIDLKYIEERDSFNLYHSNSPNHISYTTVKRDEQLLQSLIESRKSRIFGFCTEIGLLLEYIQELTKPNCVSYTFSWSNILDNKRYYCLCCDYMCNDERIYLFQSDLSFNSLSVKLVDIISCDEAIYEKLK